MNKTKLLRFVGASCTISPIFFKRVRFLDRILTWSPPLDSIKDTAKIDLRKTVVACIC